MQPFTPLYVYERMPVDGGGPTYLEVGADSKGRVLGFLKEDETIQWDHSLVLAFAERANRDRTLFFEQQAGLDEWLGSDDLLVKERVEGVRDVHNRIRVAAAPTGTPRNRGCGSNDP